MSSFFSFVHAPECAYVKLEKLYTVNLYVFFSALYMLQYVQIVTILVNCIF